VWGYIMAQSSIQEDVDQQETQEWLDAYSSMMRIDGAPRAQFVLDQLIRFAKGTGYQSDHHKNTAYCNTIPTDAEPNVPGDSQIEQRIRALIRWNAMAMVVRAQKIDSSLGGHIGTFASSATLYDVGFNHFWRGKKHACGGDLIYIQGHVSPGIYARSFLTGDISQSQLENFRRETSGKGLSSYPHPWLMPDYWQFPTVSMGLGPLQAVYQARFMRYLENRGLIEKSDRKIWCFCGDGEMDEPESTAGLSLAAREKLDNLIFVINCNLQRLDGPVRGNSKVVQEFEALFRGAGWNVIKVLWGSGWDPLFAADKSGKLLQRMEEAVDGDYQNYKAKGGAYTREHFFGKYPETAKLVENMSDKDIWRLNRGGHDPKKVYAAYLEAYNTKGKPTVILAKTVKGYGLGSAGEAQNTAHNTKKLNAEELRIFRDRFHIPIKDEDIENVPFYNPGEHSPEIKYLQEKREELGGAVMSRRKQADESLVIPGLDAFAAQLKSTDEREVSTTMAFVRILSNLVKNKEIGKRVVPIVPDEARTFGMEGLFRQVGIYSQEGQKYRPEDADQIMYYREETNGQILEEGINEAGSFCSWIAAATAYSNYNRVMIPFYIYYSMFGFQRIGDLAWLAGDMRAKGFLLGGTSGRTTLNGEGLQHQDGHSHLYAQTIPNCKTYDPTFSYELAVIIQHGLQEMYVDGKDIFYYITLLNENYTHPELPKGQEENIIKGLYLFNKSDAKGHKVQLLGCGSILREVIEASKILTEYGVSADVWSATSLSELRKDALACERHNQLNLNEKPKDCFIKKSFENITSPIICATDYMKAFSDQVSRFVPNTFISLGTDGFGRSDTREALRHHFEVDRYFIAYHALVALHQEGNIDKKQLIKAKQKLNISDNKADPVLI
jgi:pyruvate dehydrogenase E1 component